MAKDATDDDEVKEAINLETYLSKYKPTAWNRPISDFCDIPGINPTKIKEMREYFNNNSRPDFGKDSKAIAPLQSGIKFLNQPCLEKYIEALRTYFKTHQEQPASGENKEIPDTSSSY